MRRIAILSAAVSGLVASSSFAAYTFTFVNDPASPVGFDRYVLYALGTGDQASDPIFAADITLQTTGNGLKFSPPAVDPDTGLPGDIPVTIGTPPTALRTRASNIVFQTIAPGFPQPPSQASSNPDYAAYAAGLNSWQIVGFDGRPGGPGVAVDASQNGGKGAAILAAVVPDGAPAPTFSATSNVAGKSGFSQVITIGGGSPNTPPVVLPTAPTPVVFGTVVSNGATFSVTVSATDLNAADILSLTLGSLPAGITAAATGGGVSPVNFTVTGTVAYSLNKTTQTIPFTVTDGQGGSTAGSFQLVITPEPASLAALGGAALMGLIRRRK